MQVHGTPKISFSLVGVNKLSCEAVAKLNVVAAAAPLPVIGWPQCCPLTETSRLNMLILVCMLLMVVVISWVRHGSCRLLMLVVRTARTRVYRTCTACSCDAVSQRCTCNSVDEPGLTTTFKRITTNDFVSVLQLCKPVAIYCLFSYISVVP